MTRRKKLVLHRTTLRTLTSLEIDQVAGMALPTTRDIECPSKVKSFCDTCLKSCQALCTVIC